MKLKEKRQEKILRIIEMYNIETQEELTSYLMRDGFKTTQATVSRDIKDLHLTKVIGQNGKYKYAPSADDGKYSVLSSRHHTMLKESIMSMQAAQNIVVIKCYTGMAMGACAAIDSLGDEEVVGTIAGDDTIFIAAYDNDGALYIINRLTELMNENE